MKNGLHLLVMILALSSLNINAFADPLPLVVIGRGEGMSEFARYCHEFDRTLSADTLYLLTCRYYVQPGHSLTIEPGTVILGDSETGVLSYVRIEFAGNNTVTLNGEIDGLELCGVGSGTQIDHVQVSYSDDDAIAWYGGTVACNYLVAFGTLEDNCQG